jgi:hypothetical protein
MLSLPLTVLRLSPKQLDCLRRSPARPELVPKARSFGLLVSGRGGEEKVQPKVQFVQIANHLVVLCLAQQAQPSSLS